MSDLPRHLPERARQLGLEKCIISNPSMRGAEPSPKMMAQSLQALCGAIYLDTGRNIDEVQKVLRHINAIGPFDRVGFDTIIVMDP